MIQKRYQCQNTTQVCTTLTCTLHGSLSLETRFPASCRHILIRHIFQTFGDQRHQFGYHLTDPIWFVAQKTTFFDNILTKWAENFFKQIIWKSQHLLREVAGNTWLFPNSSEMVTLHSIITGRQFMRFVIPVSLMQAMWVKWRHFLTMQELFCRRWD
jgi:hypothetical protein